MSNLRTKRGMPEVTTTDMGLMTPEDKAKLDALVDSAQIYTHPTGDGNLHVPATSTTNENKVLTAGATAGSLSWKTVAELLGLDTTELALFTAFVAGGTDGQQFTMNNDGTGSWKTL